MEAVGFFHSVLEISQDPKAGLSASHSRSACLAGGIKGVLPEIHGLGQWQGKSWVGT